MEICPLLIEFIRGTLPRTGESPEATIFQNGPPGTFVILAEVTRAPPPIDQISLPMTRAELRASAFRECFSFSKPVRRSSCLAPCSPETLKLQVVSTAKPHLAYDFFRLVRRPQECARFALSASRATGCRSLPVRRVAR